MWSKLRKWLPFRENDNTVRDVIEELIEEDEAGDASLAPDEREMLTNILELRDLTVEDVMIPRAEIIALKSDNTLEEVRDLFKSHHFKRVPVYTDNLDDVSGYIDIRCLLDASPKNFNLSKLIQKIDFVAPSLRVLDLLLQMRSSDTRIALVVDEYGGVDGLISMGDIIEEIVGDIQDVASIKNPKLQYFERPDGIVVVDARIDLDDLEENTGPFLTEDEREESLDTLGGLVCHLADRVPQRGELIRHTSGLSFEIIEANPRQVKRIGIHGVQKSSAQ